MSPKRLKVSYGNQGFTEMTVPDDAADDALKALTEGRYYGINNGRGKTVLINGEKITTIEVDEV
jgi:hypothetical protein